MVTSSIKKLGLDIQSFKIGEKIKIEANTEVTEVSNTKTDGENRKTLQLQIQDLGLKKKYAWTD